jgi:hypothetical protein
MFRNYRSYYNKEPEQRWKTVHRIDWVSPITQSLPRVIGPYTLSNLCQRLYAKNLGNIRLLKGNLI